MWSPLQQTDLLSNMFSIEDVLSQGDTNSEIASYSGHLDDQCFLNRDFVDLKFLDSFTDTGKSVPTSADTNMNLDLKELLANILAGEPVMDISLINMNTTDVTPAVLPVTELSYNLNTTLQGDLISLKAAAGDLSSDFGTSGQTELHPKDGSLEVSGSAEVSSTTDALYHLMDEGTSLNCSPSSDDVLLQESDGSEILESVAGRKYLEMRRKNNVASQRSRRLRKQKNSKMSERLKELKKENKELSLLAEELEKERNTLQELLMSIIAKKT